MKKLMLTASILSMGMSWGKCPDSTGLKRAYFGDLHIHTSYSADAFGFGTRNAPKDAYLFAKKQKAVGLTPNNGLGPNLQPTRSLEIDRKLDFLGLTDHVEFLGIPTGNCSYEGTNCPRNMVDTWTSIQNEAKNANDPCNFTSFISYEYTLGLGGLRANGMQHRNVIFANDKVPRNPPGSIQFNTPQQLWENLTTVCTNAGTGCDVLTIAHNSNYSNGTYFQVTGADGQNMTSAQAQLRAKMEPLVEMIQHKGNSECLFGFGNNDEECGFGVLNSQDPKQESKGYIREGLKKGLFQQTKLGVNPFKLGFIGSTDTHNGTPGAVSESNWKGHGGNADDADNALLRSPLGFTPGGLAVVWAEENTRSSLFKGLRNRETYATSGTRPIVRMFGGWDYPTSICSASDLVKQGYVGGVPMGSDLRPAPTSIKAPRFVVSAFKDAGTSTKPGSLLQRIEIIKGWVDANGEAHEKVFQIAGNPNNGASVNLSTCQQTGTGYSSLCQVWSDPEFNATQPAFYYARILENPSCHWSKYITNASNIPHPDSLPETIQERAWTSPIWYTPSGNPTQSSITGSQGLAKTTSIHLSITQGNLVGDLKGIQMPTKIHFLNSKGQFLREIGVKNFEQNKFVIKKDQIPLGGKYIRFQDKNQTFLKKII